MILTGKCKEDFYLYLTKGMSNFAHDMEIEFFNQKSNVEKNALIIDFFDSVGWLEPNVNIQVLLWLEYSEHGVLTLKERTEKAIKKANEIYNC